MKKPVLLGILFGAAVLAAIIYATFGNTAYRCEVCITFEGRTACRTAKANSHDLALRAATENTCAQLTSGMDATNRCTNTAPDRVTWK